MGLQFGCHLVVLGGSQQEVAVGQGHDGGQVGRVVRLEQPGRLGKYDHAERGKGDNSNGYLGDRELSSGVRRGRRIRRECVVRWGHGIRRGDDIRDDRTHRRVRGGQGGLFVGFHHRQYRPGSWQPPVKPLDAPVRDTGLRDPATRVAPCPHNPSGQAVPRVSMIITEQCAEWAT